MYINYLGRFTKKIKETKKIWSYDPMRLRYQNMGVKTFILHRILAVYQIFPLEAKLNDNYRKRTNKDN